MSIKGIDTQIMINRSSDFSKDASALQRRPEMTQTALAEQQKIATAEDQNRIAKTLESEMDRIRTDDERRGGSAYGGGEHGEQSDEDSKDDNSNPSMYVPAGRNIIDIRI